MAANGVTLIELRHHNGDDDATKTFLLLLLLLRPRENCGKTQFSPSDGIQDTVTSTFTKLIDKDPTKVPNNPTRLNLTKNTTHRVLVPNVTFIYYLLK